jgi:hypothetical protein
MSTKMSAENQTVAIGDGSTLIQLPDMFELDIEDDGTLCAAPSIQPDILTLRFSVLTVTPKESAQAAKVNVAATIIDGARAKGREEHTAQDKAWYSEDQDSEQDGVPIWLRFWYVGFRNKTIIVSLCCEAESKGHALVNEMLTLIPELIPTISQRSEKSSLTRTEVAQLDQQRHLISKRLRESYDVYSLPMLRSDLNTLQRLVDDKPFSIEQEYEWSCAGVVFGDVIASELGLDWIAQCDEYGVEPALNYNKTSITVFPRPMILKRVEKGERADLIFLLDQLAKSVDEMRSKGY